MKDNGIDKGSVRSFDTSSRTKGNIFGFRKMFWDYLKKINVPFYDTCCADASTTDIYPLRYNHDSQTIQRYHAEDGWIDIRSIDFEVSELATGTIRAIDTEITLESPVVTDAGISNQTGLAHYVGFISASSQTNVTAGTGGAIPLTSYMTTINTDAGGDAFTLADGTIVGQLKKIYLAVDGGGDAVITPVSLTGGTTITMGDAGDYVVLMWQLS